MITNTVTNEVSKQTTLKNHAANNNLQFSKNMLQETKKDLKRKAARQATADWNGLLIWARKQRGPYYDPTTRMYHVNRNSKKYFAGYTEADAEIENDALGLTGQKSMHNSFIKPALHIVEKESIVYGNHMSPARVSNPSGRRPGRPRKSDMSKLN
ncbi:hypothetical protein F8M41_012639 [Gigaspora margarita]|uniref:Uncharacterized protein n=1 Tax=Gigaspora margarita TaxID=4874 RepID=A0A8H3WYN8_GIGMA|nr:hypothetical protein F8M41_012639 [Gigaspora margarita]